MFKGNRRFDGRQGEQILNEEQYLLYEILKHFITNIQWKWYIKMQISYNIRWYKYENRS